MSTVEVRVPDLGDAKGVAVLEVLVKKGASVAVDDPLITLESEKASMDVPSPVRGVIDSIAIKKGDEVGSGTLIAVVKTDDTDTEVLSPKVAVSVAPAKPTAAPAAKPTPAAKTPAPAAKPAAMPAAATAPTAKPVASKGTRPGGGAAPAAPRVPSIWSCWAPVSAATRRHFALRI